MAKNGRKDKLGIMKAAHQMGWKGKSYKKAKRFERRLNWRLRNQLQQEHERERISQTQDSDELRASINSPVRESTPSIGEVLRDDTGGGSISSESSA